MSQQLKLLRFRVTNFRSVEDSGWVDVDQVTSLIGVNESGKSNLLLPLWKFHPARGGEITPTTDFPRSKYAELRAMTPKPYFVRAEFEPNAAVAKELATLSGGKPSDFDVIQFARRLDGENKFTISFPEASMPGETDIAEFSSKIAQTYALVDAAPTTSDADAKRRKAMLAALVAASEELKGVSELSKAAIGRIARSLKKPTVSAASLKFDWAEGFAGIRDYAVAIDRDAKRRHPGRVPEVRKAALSHLPRFVYYSNYGNLDSEIYLPHVIDDLQRNDLGQKSSAQARTLRVLFDFVGLSPDEILELGRETSEVHARITDEQLEKEKERKKERDILLQSASTKLTRDFREWWKQGEYRFRFHADGNHFRIWVSDDLRPEDVELEGRSTGLQWFLSFYLVFLVESLSKHENTILLLDEPGLSLHPLAQRDLSAFFDSLAKDNQLLYTTHSPFLVDPERLDRIRMVYVDDNGHSAVTNDLRLTEKRRRLKRSLYPVNAALGISVGDAYLLGSQAVVVEGPSDQHALVAMKNHLTSLGALDSGANLLFLPADGVRGIKAVASIVAGPEQSLPIVLLDGDRSGRELAKNLRNNLYARQPESVIVLSEVTGRENDEVEDLWPVPFFAASVDRLLRGANSYFSDSAKGEFPIVSQVESFARDNGLDLTLGWKVDAAKHCRTRLAQRPDDIDAVTIERWKRVFDAILFPDRSAGQPPSRATI